MNAQDLKNSILQLAIQGKLVEQRKEEGTAKELIKQIEAEKLIAEKLTRLENIKIQGKFDYSTIKSISTEGRQKLTSHNPETIGQASRITGISPSDINVLLILLGR